MEPNGHGKEIYLNEDTGERFYYIKIIKDKKDLYDPCKCEYKVIKIE